MERLVWVQEDFLEAEQSVYASFYPGSSTDVIVSLRRKIGANVASLYANTVGLATHSRDSVRVVGGPFEANESCADPIVTIPAIFTNPAGAENFATTRLYEG